MSKPWKHPFGCPITALNFEFQTPLAPCEDQNMLFWGYIDPCISYLYTNEDYFMNIYLPDVAASELEVTSLIGGVIVTVTGTGGGRLDDR